MNSSLDIAAKTFLLPPRDEVTNFIQKRAIWAEQNISLLDSTWITLDLNFTSVSCSLESNLCGPQGFAFVLQDSSTQSIGNG
jgi:hypothetical protein